MYGNILGFCLFYCIFILVNQWFLSGVLCLPHCREEERYLANKLFSGCDLHQDHEPLKQRQDTPKFVSAAQNAVHFPSIPIIEERANLNYPNVLKQEIP